MVLAIIILLVSQKILDKKNLGNNYYYLSKEDVIDLGYNEGQVIYKSNKTITNTFEINKIIHGDVVDYKSNSKYIIVIQEPNKLLLYNSLKNELLFWNKYYSKKLKDSIIDLSFDSLSLTKINTISEDSKKIDIVVDSILINNNFYKKMLKNKKNYYIIDKDNDSVFGPFDKHEFNNLIKIKNIKINF